MRRITRCFSRRNEGGSTILELLVALLVISALGVGAWHAAGVSLRMAHRLRHSLTAGARLLQLDDALRDLAASVIPPYWAPEQLVEASDTGLTVPYLDGCADRSLVMRFENGVLHLGDGQHWIQYSGLQSVTFSAATEGQLHYGVTVRLEWTGGRSAVMTARFGGTPAGSAGSP
ncbi:MAG: type II secretion system protein J [Spirochaetia bacterium]